jgi:hypothetical protein
MAVARSPKKRTKSFALYWCSTPDGDEDWFVVASTARAARSFHERAEGYDSGEAEAERVVPLPPELVRKGAWRDPERDEWLTAAAWPSDAVIEACGGEIAPLDADGIRVAVGVVCKVVRFGDRAFRAGDVVSNNESAMGIRGPPRLAVFRGGKKE